MISKYGPLLSKSVSPVDPSFLVVKKSHLIKIFILQESTNSTKQKDNVAATKKDKTKILITNGSLMKIERIAECRILLTCIKG